ncbi:hypothetical protein NT2_02_03530 [Caenibius tardaugens NBRC 16725]|uniref:Uncharacterized protein n=1 Tax=Caenibius tardaugens NBRC 16725 TaxID=1219035 RepID=U2Y559_9SPHN|nr:hypothetical protein [Caenibius tardaugens]AZI34752.1 hypothetical protein EGO55_01300 [Caenibius tardaugens NBRC 16725]GAD48271.1 hypothetical protein NT2_02_03530 [Caenibius tardaugens NBRC 16725]
MIAGRRLATAMGMAVLSFLGAGQAVAATDMNCVEAYDAAQVMAIDDFVRDFDLDGLDGRDPPEALLEVYSARAGACADQHNWSSDAVLYAVFYQIGRTLERALRAHAPLSEADLARFDRTVAGADQNRLWPILEKMVGGSVFGTETDELSESDEMFLGMLILSSGIPANEKNSGFAGALLAAQAMQRYSSQHFGSK